MRRVSLVSICVLFAASLFAQTTALPQERQKLGGTNPTARITREALHQLLMLPYYSVFDDLAYKVEDHTVYLYGEVVNAALKPDAESAVKQIEGVEKVVNNIQVLPPSPADDRIRRAEYRAIYGNEVLSKYSLSAVPSIHIIVKNGHVTLVGVVDAQADKQIAGMQARGVPGVFSVDNQLQVGSSGIK
jgi:osmotically-inducible protein OsmY